VKKAGLCAFVQKPLLGYNQGESPSTAAPKKATHVNRAGGFRIAKPGEMWYSMRSSQKEVTESRRKKPMSQQLTITTTDKTMLKPLVESALENEKKMLALGIERTRKRLAEFEQQFGMSSAEFERRLNALELIETVEFTDWRMEVGMLHLLESQYRALREAQLD
jgi:VCBS repeat-containing protein